ncbi:MAG: hypothetical protein K2O60_06565 [Ruminococcus sp.]|nr:hypothetical protein [Ruminococcus sp.]
MAKEDEIAYLKKINKNFPIIVCTPESKNEEKKIRQIMLDKLKEMSEIEFEDCSDPCDYTNICSVMNEIAKTLLDK